MNTMRTSRLIPATVAALAALALTASPALADGGSGHSILKDKLVGSMPAPASPTIDGIAPGGAPWVNGPSKVRVREDGRITVKIKGLIIPTTGVNPVASVVATLVCDGEAGDSTDPFALSAAGDGSTSDVISGTRHCEDPMVLIQPTGRAIYIASTVDDDHDD